ncbi:MAG: hypothetical protein ACREMA_02140 [Longimicrobiales bacterium]
MSGGRKKKSPGRATRRPASVRERAVAYAVDADDAERERPIKKNLRLHQSKIDEARRVLGTNTETETIEVALDLVVFGKELAAGVRSMRGTNLVDFFEGDT